MGHHRRASKGSEGPRRHLSAIAVYNLAAEMERRIEALGDRWVVSPAVFDQRIDLELGDNRDEAPARRSSRQGPSLAAKGFGYSPSSFSIDVRRAGQRRGRW